MYVVVHFRKIWGKELFYPVSDDALFIAQLSGRPTILRNQLRLCRERGWKVEIIPPPINIDEVLL
jgi:hypothetical protein